MTEIVVKIGTWFLDAYIYYCNLRKTLAIKKFGYKRMQIVQIFLKTIRNVMIYKNCSPLL